MTIRMLLAIMLLAIAATAGALMFYVSVMPILIAVDLMLVLLCAFVLALGSGWLERWIELVEEEPPPVREPRHGFRLLVWPRASHR